MTPFTTSVVSPRVTSRVAPALAAILFGAVLFVGAGFASPAALHNAAHDMRHALGLPCH